MEPRKIAPEMVELMVYCKAVSFGRDALKSTIGFADFGNCEVEMNSFNEIRAKELMVEEHRPAFQWRHRKYLSRVYPKVSKETSDVLISCSLSDIYRLVGQIRPTSTRYHFGSPVCRWSR